VHCQNVDNVAYPNSAVLLK